MSIRAYKGIFPTIDSTAYIDEDSVVIGKVTVGRDSSFWPCAVARGDVNQITIGARTSVQDGAVLHVTHDGPFSPGGKDLTIGDDVTIGHQAMLHACDVGNRCLIGMSAVILDKAVLQDDVFLAAGAVVPPGKILESGYLYRGNPAKQARALSAKELEMLKYSAENYVKVKNSYMESTDAP